MNEIGELTDRALRRLTEMSTREEVTALKVELLGKSGELTGLLRGLKNLPESERPEYGKRVNEARAVLDKAVEERFNELSARELEAKMDAERIDITEPAERPAVGRVHPLTAVKNKAVQFFVAMGFSVAESPEIETTHYNFDMLNMPADHPARAEQDTFFITDEILLRTQTSAGQIRMMESVRPPIKMISPGRVYRADEIDATHTPCFHQIEGLVVDNGISMSDLKGILGAFAKYFFSDETTTRFRPSFFPFTEPSVEVDASCPACGGKGCRVCKGTGWIEILGAGMVNRRVLEGCGIDPDIYSGFAFGMGLDRITAILHGITDARVPFEGDIRFLKQFDGEEE